jgi:hypothetical protein
MRTILFIFVFVTAFSLTAKSLLEKIQIDQEVLIGGNLVLFLASAGAYFISSRALASENPNAFVRAMYASFMVKFFLVIIAAFVYIMIAKKNVNKPALMICGALYIVYTFIETRALTRLLKKKKNA